MVGRSRQTLTNTFEGQGSRVKVDVGAGLGGKDEEINTRAGEGTVPLGLLTRLLFLVLFVCGCAGEETQEEG